MRKLFNNVLLGLCLASLTACQKASDDIQQEDTLLPMSITARIGNAEPASSRYAGSLENATFSEGDKIGMFMEKTNLTQWNYGSMGWSSVGLVVWPDTEVHKFDAFYPYMEGKEYSYTSIPMPSLLGQEGTFLSIASKDFLVASTSQSYDSDGIVKFKGVGKTFQHVSALVHLQLKDTLDLDGATINRIMIEGKDIVAPSVYSFETTKVLLNTDGQSDELDVSLEHDMDGNADFYFVLNAKPSTTGDVTLTIEYTIDSKKYIAQSTQFSGNTFESGCQHNFTISILHDQMFISDAEISGWNNKEIQDIIINSQEKQDE